MTWTIGVIPGPHCTEEYLKPDYLNAIDRIRSWEVHFNSSRTGVRLIGPAPLWTREDGGEAGFILPISMITLMQSEHWI